jgi:subtilase family serine protease
VNEANGSRAASASYGECEPTAGDLGSNEAFLPASAQLEYSTDAYLVSYEQGLSEAVMLGKTLFSSSGDDGSSCGALPVDLNGVANEGVPGVGYPASSPNAVGVGGTVLYGTQNTLTAPASNAQRFDEYAWTYSGGGPSNVFPEPSYQSSSSAIAATSASTALAPNVPCVTNLQGTVTVPPPTCRKDPDVSAISGDILTNGYNIVDMGADTSTGGTSLSSPLTLGLWTCIESACGGNGPVFANYTFYTHTADFFDPGGLTDSTVATNGAWQSGPGYDYATGLGVIDVAKMMTDVCKTTSPGAAPTDEAAFPLTTPTTLGTAILPETAVPATLLVVAVIVGGTVLGRRRRKAARP